MESLYENVGAIIKKIASIQFIIGSIIYIIFGILCFTTYSFFSFYSIISGILIIILGPLSSYVTTITLYGFGELIEKVHEIAENTAPDRNLTTGIKVKNSKKTSSKKGNSQNIEESFLELLSHLPEVKKDNDFVNFYNQNIEFQIELQNMDNIQLQLEFIKLKHKFYDTEMTKDQLEEQETKLFENYNYKPLFSSDEKVKNDNLFQELLKQLTEIKNDKDFLEIYKNDTDFQEKLNSMNNVNLQLKFVDLAYEFYDTDMTEKELEEKQQKLFSYYGFNPKQ